MTDTIRLTCPTCGAKLEVTQDMDRFACLYCGNEMLVIRRGGTASLKPVVEELERVRDGAVRTASELAIERLDKEIAALWSQRRNLDSALASPGCAFALGAIGLLFFAVAVYDQTVYQKQDNWQVAFACGLPIIVIAFVWFTVSLNRRSESEREKHRLDSLIAQKTDERHRHQEIVGKAPQE